MRRGKDEKILGIKERKRERDHTCAYVHTNVVFSSFRLSSEGLSHSTHMEHFEESDSLYFKGTCVDSE